MFIFKINPVWCFEGDGGGQGNGGGDGGDGGGDGGIAITPEIAGQVLSKWREHIPEELATDSTLEGFEGKGFDAIVKGYSSLARKLGKNPIVRPDRCAFRLAAGPRSSPFSAAASAPAAIA